LLEESSPGIASVGKGADPGAELIRFQGSFDLGFPASDVQQVKKGLNKENPVQIKTNFLNIGGPFGPLPIPYSQFILERYNRKDRGISQFLNNFQHRIISLLFRALEYCRPAMDGTTVENEKYARHVLSTLGLGTKAMSQRMSVPDRAIMGFSCLFLSGSRSFAGLENLLSYYFKTKIKVKPFSGGWSKIPERHGTVIGKEGKNNALGYTFVIGQRAWLQQTRFTILVKSVPWETYRDFLPDGDAYKSLVDLVKLYAGAEFDCALELGIAGTDVPGSILGETKREQTFDDFKVVARPRLGWDFILRTNPQPLEKSPTAKLNLI